jgi:hypothetical protein
VVQLRKRKRELKYYKEVINHNLENQKYSFVLVILKKKTNIVKIKTNSREHHSEIGCSTIPKTP